MKGTDHARALSASVASESHIAAVVVVVTVLDCVPWSGRGSGRAGEET